MDADYYRHVSTGRILYDPGKGSRHFDPWYALLECDGGIIDYLSWHLRRWGIDLHKGSRWGAHVTFVRGEQPLNLEAWGEAAGEEVTFHYAHEVRWTNGFQSASPAMLYSTSQSGRKVHPWAGNADLALARFSSVAA